MKKSVWFKGGFSAKGCDIIIINSSIDTARFKGGRSYVSEKVSDRGRLPSENTEGGGVLYGDNRNTDVPRRIISYCNEISEAIQRFGELTTHLTDDFKQTYIGMPWTQIKALRNVVSHSYGKIDDESKWETITSDIPKLKDYCSEIIQQFDILMQESANEPGDE